MNARRPRITFAAAAAAALSLVLLGACGSSTQDQAQSLAAALSSGAAAGQASAEQALSAAEQAVSSAQASLQEAGGDQESTSPAEPSADEPTTDEPTGSDPGASTSASSADGMSGTSSESVADGSIDEMAAMSPECQDTLSGFLAISPLLLGPITGGSITQAEIDEAFAAADGVLPADLADEAAVIRQAAEDSIGVDMTTASDIVGDAKVTAAMDALSEAVDQQCGG